jgi:type I restriction enzyme S subunit
MPGYALPERWRWVRLGDVCQTEVETRDPRQIPDTSFKYVDISSVNNQAKLIENWRELLGRDAPSRARKVIHAGDVIVATTRPYLNGVAHVPAELDGEICSTGFCVLRAVGEIAPRFLFAFVQTRSFIEQVSGRMRGASYPAVSDQDVFAVPLPLPPFDEQRCIVARLEPLLAEVEEAEAEIEEAAEKTERLWELALWEAFAESNGTKKTRLSDVVKIDAEMVDPREPRFAQLPHVGGANIESLTGQFVNLRTVDQSKLISGKYLFTDQHVLYCKIRPYLRKVATPSFTGLCSADIYPVRPLTHMITKEYLGYLLQSPQFTRYAVHLSGRAQMPKLNRQQLQGYETTLPALDDQRRVVCHLNAVAEHQQALHQEQAAMRQKLSRLRTSLLDAAFRGEL